MLSVKDKILRRYGHDNGILKGTEVQQLHSLICSSTYQNEVWNSFLLWHVADPGLLPVSPGGEDLATLHVLSMRQMLFVFLVSLSTAIPSSPTPGTSWLLALMLSDVS